MSEIPMDQSGQPVTRRGLLGKGGTAMAGAALAAGLTAGAAGAQSQVTKKRTRTYEIAPDVNSLVFVFGKDVTGPYSTGPFYLEGALYKKGAVSAIGLPIPQAARAGTWRCWGWVYDPRSLFAVSHQWFQVDGEGDIHALGQFNGGRLAVAGGTGLYLDARGEGAVQGISPSNFSFRVIFTLI